MSLLDEALDGFVVSNEQDSQKVVLPKQEELVVDQELLQILDDALKDFVKNVDGVQVSNVYDVARAQDVIYLHASTSQVRGGDESLVLSMLDQREVREYEMLPYAYGLQLYFAQGRVPLGYALMQVHDQGSEFFYNYLRPFYPGR